MAAGPRKDGWQNYHHHTDADIADWDSGKTLKRTKHGDAQYNPHRYNDPKKRRALELGCILKGTTISETANRITKFLKIKGEPVGACSGVLTQYVFAECTSGFYHGRPICVQELKRLGVTL